MRLFKTGPLAVAFAAGALLAGPALAANVQGNAEITPAIQHDHLQSLRNVLPLPEDLSGGKKEKPIKRLPHLDAPGNAADPVVQSGPSAPLAPTAGLGFDGVGNGFQGPQGTFTVNSAPPDTNGAMGSTQYVQIVNTSFAVFDKASGNVLYGPAANNTLWSGFGGPCETNNDGDPIVVYDKAANRWVISQFSATAPYLECVAVSQSADATGGYNRYAFSYGSVFPDYPKMGVWPDAYYITFNMFTNTFQGARLCAYDRTKMLAGQPATQQCFQLSSSFGGVLPADRDGSTAPPAGSPEYFVSRGSSTLFLWKFHVDWANTANTTLTGPASIPVAAFTSACNGGACIPQPNTNQQLDSLADRLMFRLAYRNFGTHESLVVNHSVMVGAKKRTAFSGVRWYEIRSPGGAPAIFQQGTYAPDSNHRWMGSIAQDKQGNMALGYSVSSKTVFPSIRYTGRLAGDPLGTMQTEATVVSGAGSQLANLNRWGDYAAMTIDPVNDCTFWFTTEYLKASGTFNWSTRIASFKFPGCN